MIRHGLRQRLPEPRAADVELIAALAERVTDATGRRLLLVFSIGHAGFMAIGAYTSAFVTVQFGDRVRAALRFLPDFASDGALLLLALAFGALLAAAAGFFVGVPSLRLRGDYLAIVTLGFGEIIRVWILNIDAVGGARGYSGIRSSQTSFGSISSRPSRLSWSIGSSIPPLAGRSSPSVRTRSPLRRWE